MIHYTCDACCRTIKPEHEIRYVVRLEVYAAIDDDNDPAADQEDHLQEIDELLDGLAKEDEELLDEELYQQVRYDLCAKCRKRFLSNPLGFTESLRLGFSQN